MQPKTARDPSHHHLASFTTASLAVIVLLGAVVVHHWRQGHLDARGGAATPTTNPAAGEESAQREDVWTKLTRHAGNGEMVLFGLPCAKPPEIDGQIGDDEWSGSFETSPINPAIARCEQLPSVRCTWDEKRLYVAIELIRSNSTCEQFHCQWVIASRDPAICYRFTVQSDGVRTACRLTLDEAQPIPAESWQAQISCSQNKMAAEFAISAPAMGLDSLTGCECLLSVCRMVDGPADKLDDPVTPAYWLLDSLRGYRTNVVLFGSDTAPDASVQWANGFGPSASSTLQWNADSVTTIPGRPLNLHATVLCRGLGADKDQIRASLAGLNASDIALEVQTVREAKTPLGLLRHLRMVVPPLSVRGFAEVNLVLPGTGSGRAIGRPLWVIDNWEKSARQYLLATRSGIEKDSSDPWRRSILLSHVGKCMDLISSDRELGLPFLRSLRDLHEAIRVADTGQTPQLPTGRSKLLFPITDGTAEVTLDVPAHYDPRLPWPVYWGQSGLPNLINVQPISLAGQMAASPELQKAIRIDADRRYLCDWCGGAYVATDMIVAQPELWAAAVLAIRARWSPLIANACHVPLLVYTYPTSGSSNLDSLITDASTEWNRQNGCSVTYTVLPRYQHAAIPTEHLPATARWLLARRRIRAPATVECRVRGGTGRNYWVSIDAVCEPERVSSITATMRGNRVIVQVDRNILAYTLRLLDAPIPDGHSKVEIVENGQSVGTIDPNVKPIFNRNLIPEEASVLAHVGRPHPAWQWTQLIADIARQKTGAQAFFSPRMTRTDPSTLVGNIGAHDLYRCFHNDWLAVAHIDAATRKTILPKLFGSSPDAVAVGLFESATPTGSSAPAASQPTPDGIITVATPADCDELSRRGGKVNAYQLASDHPACVAEYAVHCQLLSMYVVDCFVAYLEEHPGLDLDALLDSQQRCSKDRVEALRVLGQGIGL